MPPTPVEGRPRGDIWQDRLPPHRARAILGSGPAGTRDYDQRSGEAEAGGWDMARLPVLLVERVRFIANTLHLGHIINPLHDLDMSWQLP